MARDQPEMYSFQGPLTEESVAEIAVLPEMEWRTTVLRFLLRQQTGLEENTEITSDTQEVVNRSIGKVDEMYEVVKPFADMIALGGKFARAGLWALARVERCLMRLQRVWKPVAVIATAAAVALTYYRTGHFPTWVDKVIPLVFGG